MPICDGCGGSFQWEFCFCPFCGRAAPEPPVQMGVNLDRFEEAELEFLFEGRQTLTEYPFNWRPNLLEKALGDRGKYWEEMLLYRLALVSIHPEKGKYIAYQTSLFGLFETKAYDDMLMFPIPIRNKILHSKEGITWLHEFFEQRKAAWEGLNRWLIQNQWVGLTPEAIRRAAPFNLEAKADFREPDLYLDGNLLITRFKSVEKLSKPYRYRRFLA